MVTHQRSRGSTQDDVRRHNLATILSEVHRRGPRSRAQLTQDMGLNRSTIGALVAELAAAGLVLEGPSERSPDGRGRAGRPSLMVAPRPDCAYVLAVDLGVRHLTVARVGLGGRVLDRVEVPSWTAWSDLADAVAVIAATCGRLLAAAPGGCGFGVGVAIPGVVRKNDGLVRFTPNLGWVDVPFGAQLAERLGQPVRVGNDADLGVLAEHRRGAAAGCEHVVYVTGEVGVGGGIIVDGQPLRGLGGYAGEIGHITVNPAGQRCRCGSRGCLETEIGVEALLRAVGQRTTGDIEAYRRVLAAGRAGDPAAYAAMRAVARWLGVGVGLLVNTFNPELVVIGGPLGELFAATEGVVLEALEQASLVAPWEQVRIVPSALGPDSALVGAAELAFAPLLQDPLGTIARPA